MGGIIIFPKCPVHLNKDGRRFRVSFNDSFMDMRPFGIELDDAYVEVIHRRRVFNVKMTSRLIPLARLDVARIPFFFFIFSFHAWQYKKVETTTRWKAWKEKKIISSSFLRHPAVMLSLSQAKRNKGNREKRNCHHHHHHQRFVF